MDSLFVPFFLERKLYKIATRVIWLPSRAIKMAILSPSISALVFEENSNEFFLCASIETHEVAPTHGPPSGRCSPAILSSKNYLP